MKFSLLELFAAVTLAAVASWAVALTLSTLKSADYFKAKKTFGQIKQERLQNAKP